MYEVHHVCSVGCLFASFQHIERLKQRGQQVFEIDVGKNGDLWRLRPARRAFASYSKLSVAREFVVDLVF